MKSSAGQRRHARVGQALARVPAIVPDHPQPGRAGVIGVLQELLDDPDAAGIRADEAAKTDRQTLFLTEALADDGVPRLHD
jgi:hypothetical protein